MRPSVPRRDERAAPTDDGFAVALADSRPPVDRWGRALPDRAIVVEALARALAVIDALRLPGESLLDAFDRLAVAFYYSEASGSEILASRRLGVSSRRMNYHLRLYGLRPIDRRRHEEGTPVEAPVGAAPDPDGA